MAHSARSYSCLASLFFSLPTSLSHLLKRLLPSPSSRAVSCAPPETATTTTITTTRSTGSSGSHYWKCPCFHFKVWRQTLALMRKMWRASTDDGRPLVARQATCRQQKWSDNYKFTMGVCSQCRYASTGVASGGWGRWSEFSSCNIQVCLWAKAGFGVEQVDISKSWLPAVCFVNRNAHIQTDRQRHTHIRAHKSLSTFLGRPPYFLFWTVCYKNIHRNN